MGAGRTEFHGGGITVEYGPTEGRVVLTDTIERCRIEFLLGGSDPPETVSTDSFRAPVGVAVSIRTEQLTLPTPAITIVRDESGAMLAELEQGDDRRFDGGQYELELGTPIKCYLRVHGPLEVSVGDAVTITVEQQHDVHVGARSKHERPAATVTTTDDPEDVMAALSTLGSALKTTSPERSFPTLRGHPPTITLGDELEIPSTVEPPETGIRIEVPPRFESIYPVAPLAYYLGARIVPAHRPALVTDGVEHRFDADVETWAQRVLKQTFLLDCVVRTEGLYTVDLNERAALEQRVDLPWERLYDAPIAQRLDRYLDVEYDRLSDLVPEWKLVSHVDPAPERVETLPYLVDDLAIVKNAAGTTVSADAIDAGGLHGTVRGSDADSGSFVRTDDPTDALEATWVGEGMPVEASKALTTAYRNRIDREPAEGPIEIAVVANDPEMDAEVEDVIDGAYGARSELPFEVSVHRKLAAEGLADVLSAGPDFLHYVGHIDAEGFRCTDGHLDATALESVDLDAFLLNACRSFEQGRALVDAGAVGGIVTLSDVVNVGAVRIGSTVARLLDSGFPLWAALDVAQVESVIAPEYTVIGDGGVALSQPETGIPYVLEVDRATVDTVDLSIRTFAGFTGDMGGLFYPFVEDNDQHYISSGTIDTFSLDRSEFEQFVPMADAPIVVDGRVRWCSSTLVDEI